MTWQGRLEDLEGLREQGSRRVEVAQFEVGASQVSDRDAGFRVSGS